MEFSQARSSTHRVIFSNVTDADQRIYSLDVDTGQPRLLFTFPAAMSLHQQPDVNFTDPEGREVPIKRPHGLQPRWMHLSPDAYTLVTIHPAVGGYSNFLHQVDLATGEVISIKLMEGYDWTVPRVASRMPEFEGIVGDATRVQLDVTVQFDNVAWSPDSSSFTFTIGDPAGPRNQIYYVARGSAEPLPLAVDAPGTDIGVRAAWSPDATRIAFARNASREGIWLIELQSPDSAHKLLDLPEPAAEVGVIKWSEDGERLLFNAFSVRNPFDYTAYLFAASGSELTELMRSQPQTGESILVGILASSFSQGSALLEEDQLRSASWQLLRRRLLYVDLKARSVSTVVERQGPFQSFPYLPDMRALITSGEPCTGEILEIPQGNLILGPSPDLCFDQPLWSPDGRLIAGKQADQVVIWDLEISELTVGVPDLVGEKVILGWVREP